MNAGAPLNTAGDDIYFVLDSTGRVGFYSSFARSGAGEKDIYRVQFFDQNESGTKHGTSAELHGRVTDGRGHRITAHAAVTDESGEVLAACEISPTAEYTLRIPAGRAGTLRVSALGYFDFLDTINALRAGPYRKDVSLVKIEAGASLVLKNIFFDFNESRLRQESTRELERLADILREYPGLRIEIASHTDGRGAEAYNLALSQSRAQAVVDRLVLLGIPAGRMVARGYGETRPVAPNVKPDGSDDEEGRALNRRTEFRILSK